MRIVATWRLAVARPGTAAASRDVMTTASNVARGDVHSRTQPTELSALASGRTLGLAQGIAYIGMGLWPTFSLRSFARVTGPKPEGWLVKAVSLLLVSIGTSMVRGARAREMTSVPTLGFGTGAALGGVAFYYAAKKRISPIYFVDSALHLSFAAAWSTFLLLRGSRTIRRVRVG